MNDLPEGRDNFYDDRGRLTEPDGEIVEFAPRDGADVVALMPSRAYVERRTQRYRAISLLAVVVAAAGCGVHWLMERPAEIGGYVILIAFTALIAALGVRIWNATIRSAIILQIGRELDVRIATLRLRIDTRRGERLGLKASGDGELWKVYRLDPSGRPSLKFKLARAAFPALPAFFTERIAERWTDLDADEA